MSLLIVQILLIGLTTVSFVITVLAIYWANSSRRLHAKNEAVLGNALQQLIYTQTVSGSLLEFADRHTHIMQSGAESHSVFADHNLELKIVRISKNKPFPRHVHQKADQIFVAWTGTTTINFYEDAKQPKPILVRNLIRNGKISGTELAAYAYKGQYHELVTTGEVAEALVISFPPLVSEKAQ